jgi:arginine-tRNA-protein transferase
VLDFGNGRISGFNMRHTLPLATQFYVTAPQPCPYLAGQTERKLFTALQGDHANLLNDSLSQQGFRRSQNVLYRPACSDCNACMSARIDISKFTPSKSQKRVMRRNKFLEREAASPWATEAQYELFSTYLESRHADGGMADMDVFEFAAMVEETSVRSRVVEYFDHGLPANERQGLVASCLTDVLKDGLSMVYSFFEPSLSDNSPGTYMILDHIEIARDAGLPYVYLGYWVPGSSKMDYKARFKGIEIFERGQWSPLNDPAEFKQHHVPAGSDPIPEQVAAIQLPDIASPVE